MGISESAHSRARGLDVEKPETLDDLQMLIAVSKPDVICIGPAKNLMRAPISGNATSTSVASFKLAELIESWADEGMAVLLEHHTPKGGRGLAGDGTLERSATHAVQLTERGRLMLTKEREARSWASFGQLVQASPRTSGNGRWTQKAGSARESEPEPADPGPSETEHGEMPTDRRNRVLDHLKEHPDEVGQPDCTGQCSRHRSKHAPA